jgi:exodeoxyribonuclease V alpha subunit
MTTSISSRLSNDVLSLPLLFAAHGAAAHFWWATLLQWRVLTVEALLVADRLVGLSAERTTIGGGGDVSVDGGRLVSSLAENQNVNLDAICDQSVAVAVLALSLRGSALGVVAVDIARRPEPSLDVLPVSSADTVGADASAGFEWPDEERIVAALAAVDAVAQQDVLGGASLVQRTPFVLVDAWLYAERYLHAEVGVAESIKERVARLPASLPGTEAVTWAEILTQGGVDASGRPTRENRQALAAYLGLDSPIFALIGGPGTGKTTTLRAMLALRAHASLKSGEPLPQFALAAPTGKAAARMKESLAGELPAFVARMAECGWDAADIASIESWLVAMVPSTIHRLIGKSGYGATRHHAFNPVAVDGVVIDEASMVDLELMSELLAALPAESQLWLLGDRHQLASVEVGSVLADITRGVWDQALAYDHGRAAQARAHWGGSGGVTSVKTHALSSCVVELLESRRFKDDTILGRFATSLVAIDGRGKGGEKALAALGELGDAEWRSRGDALSERLHDPARAGHVEWLAAGYEPYLVQLQNTRAASVDCVQWHRDLLEALNAYRVLTARRGTRWGVDELNSSLQKELGRMAGRTGDRLPGRLWVGLPMLIRRNDYDVDLRNGDVGICVAAPEDVARNQAFRTATHVVFPDASAPVGLKYVSVTQLPEHEPALVMTVHKSQGSEFNTVGLVVADSAASLLNRELVYTGLTRSKGAVRVLGSKATLEMALARNAPSGSLLWQRLWGTGAAQARRADRGTADGNGSLR